MSQIKKTLLLMQYLCMYVVYIYIFLSLPYGE